MVAVMVELVEVRCHKRDCQRLPCRSSPGAIVQIVCRCANQLELWSRAGIWIGGEDAEPLRTMTTYGCRAFVPDADIRRDPDADLTDEQRDVLEEATQWVS